MKELKIGRSHENDIVIDDPSVSRQHASIWINNSEYSLQDNGSSNGTFINGMIINGSARLNRHDILKVGNSLVPWMNYIGSNSEAAKTRVSPPSQPSQSYTTTHSSNVMRNLPNASGALTCGIIGLVFSFWGILGIIGLILCIIAVALGASGMSKYKQNPDLYRSGSYSNARAGMVLGIIGMSLFVLMILFVVIALNL